MAVEPEKERISAEISRNAPESPTAPILPIVNPAVEKSDPPKAKLHPSIYIM